MKVYNLVNTESVFNFYTYLLSKESRLYNRLPLYLKKYQYIRQLNICIDIYKSLLSLCLEWEPSQYQKALYEKGLEIPVAYKIM